MKRWNKVPESGTGKNIVVCIDGTGNGPRGAEATNVWRLFEALAEIPGQQCKCYLPGVGAQRGAPIYTPGKNWTLRVRRPLGDALPVWIARCGPLGRKLAGGTGLGTADRITLAYAFLCHHYRPGDRIYLFGFSRGATAVRSLAGFMDTVGLLFHDRLECVAEAYRLYVDPRHAVRDDFWKYVRRVTGVWIQPRSTYLALRRGEGAAPARTLPLRYRMSAHFLGVWDTVASLGLPGRLPEHHRTEVPPFVGRARHALAVHELRGWAFPPLLFTRCAGRDVKQVWFAGAHADVGGGYPKRGLADITLAWMLGEAASLEASAAAPSGLLLADAGDKGGEDARQCGSEVAQPVLHEEISAPGSLWLDIPAVRRPLAQPGRLTREVLESFAVHPSALQRLLGPQAVSYRFGPGRFGEDVNPQLVAADDALLRLILLLHRHEQAPFAATMKCRSSREDDGIFRGKDGQLPAQGWQDAESVALLNALPDAIRGFYAGQGDAREFAGWLTLIGAVVLLKGREAQDFGEEIVDFLQCGIGLPALNGFSTERKEAAGRILESIVEGFPSHSPVTSSLRRLLVSLHNPPHGHWPRHWPGWKL